MNTCSHLFFNFAFFSRTGEVLIFSRLSPCTNLECEISLMKMAILILAAVSRVNKVVTTCELCLPRNINHLCGSHTQWIMFFETTLDCFNVLPSNWTNKSHWKMHSSRLSTWNWKSKRKIRLKSQMKKSFTESGCADSEHSAKEESTQLQSLFPESQVPWNFFLLLVFCMTFIPNQMGQFLRCAKLSLW